MDPETQEFHIDGYDHHTNLQVKEREINEKYQATILQQQDFKFMEYVAC